MVFLFLANYSDSFRSMQIKYLAFVLFFTVFRWNCLFLQKKQKTKYVSCMEMAPKLVVARVKIPQSHTQKGTLDDCQWLSISGKIAVCVNDVRGRTNNRFTLFFFWSLWHHFGEIVERKINLWPFITRRKSNRNSCAFQKTINSKRCFCNKALNCTITKRTKERISPNYQKWCFSCCACIKKCAHHVDINFVYLCAKQKRHCIKTFIHRLSFHAVSIYDRKLFFMLSVSFGFATPFKSVKRIKRMQAKVMKKQ